MQTILQQQQEYVSDREDDTNVNQELPNENPMLRAETSFNSNANDEVITDRELLDETNSIEETYSVYETGE